jgi:hypothetical protein
MLNTEERVAIVSAQLRGLSYQQGNKVLKENSENQLLLKPVPEL